MDLWKKTLTGLQARVEPWDYKHWILPVQCDAQDEVAREIVLAVPDESHGRWLEDHFTGFIHEELERLGQGDYRIRFTTYAASEAAAGGHHGAFPGPSHASPSAPPSVREVMPIEAVEPIEPPALNDRYRFESFVDGPTNQFAMSAAHAVADHPGTRYNPLFIFGGVGLGKTHLLHAIGHAVREKNPHARVRYVTSEQFVNELILAIRTDKMQAFRSKYRDRCDVLLIDDIQFIAGKEGTQDEFFHTFNDLHSHGKQVIISSDRPPKSLATLEERLLSRFEWGLTADVQPPDEETRRAILLAKADDLNRYVPDEVIEFIAHNSRQNIRELEGALNKVVAYAGLTDRPIDLELVNLALADTLRRPERISVEQIIDIVCRYYNVTADAIISSSRKSTIAHPRQVAMYLSRTETDASLPQIGAQLGPRDHTTVLHGAEKIKSLVDIDPQLRRDLLEIKAMLYERAAVITH